MEEFTELQEMGTLFMDPTTQQVNYGAVKTSIFAMDSSYQMVVTDTHHQHSFPILLAVGDLVQSTHIISQAAQATVAY